MEKKKTIIKDIYEGKQLSVWEDGETVTLAFGLTTIAFPFDDGWWKEVREDLKKLAKVI